MNVKKIVRRTLWVLAGVVVVPGVALAHLRLTEVIATLAWYFLAVVALIAVWAFIVRPIGGRVTGRLRTMEPRQRWRLINLGLTAIAGALVSHLLTHTYYPHLPELYRLYWLIVAWAVIIGACAYAYSPSWRNHLERSWADRVEGQLRYNNNARWCLLAFVAFNATMLAIFYGLPFSVLSVSEIADRASSGVNEVWGACRGTLGFILYGNRDALGLTLVTPCAVSDAPGAAKGWSHICVALCLVFFTLLYMPKAFADDVLGKLRTWNESLRTQKKAEGETTETPAARTPSGFNWRHFLSSIAGYVGVDVVIESLIKVFEKKASA